MIQKSQKVIMIPEWQYNKMLKSYDNAIEELEKLRKELHSYRQHTSENGGAV